MIQRALKIQGGLALHLFGSTERYAMKELGFRGILSPGLTRDLISGSELVQIASQAAVVKARRELPDTP